MAQATTTETFAHDVLEAQGPVLVDFWAEWCGPCRQLLPVVEALAQERSGSLSVCKINIDEHPDVPTSYGVRSIPTLMLFQNGKVLGTKVGALSKPALIAWVDQTLAGHTAS